MSMVAVPEASHLLVNKAYTHAAIVRARGGVCFRDATDRARLVVNRLRVTAKTHRFHRIADTISASRLRIKPWKHRYLSACGAVLSRALSRVRKK
jgi:hypothetical protein